MGRNVALRVLALVCLLLLPAVVVAAQDDLPTCPADSDSENKTSCGFDADYNGRYLWRGLAYSEGAVIQPSVWLTSRGTTYSVWANRDLDTAGREEFNEVDFGLSWEGKWNELTLEPCVWYDTYPNQDDSPSTVMADIKVSRPLGPLSVFTTHSFDVLEYHGAYYGDLGLCYTRDLTEQRELETSILLGWQSAEWGETYFGARRSGLFLGELSVSLTYTSPGGLYVRPHLTVSRLLGATIRDAVEEPDLVAFGVSLGKEL